MVVSSSSWQEGVGFDLQLRSAKSNLFGRRYGGFHVYISYEVGCGFGSHGVDEHSRAEFEAGYAGEARNDAQIPVEIFYSHPFRRRATNCVIEVGILQSVVELGEDGAQRAGEIGDLGGADIAEAGHMASRIDVGGKRGGGGIEFESHEMVRQHDDALLLFKLFLNH